MSTSSSTNMMGDFNGWATNPSPHDPRNGPSSAPQHRQLIDMKSIEKKYPRVYGTSTLSTMAANMRIAAATFSGPLIPDGPNASAISNNGNSNSNSVSSMQPFPCDFYTEAELKAVSLLQLYHRSCALLGVKPNKVVERHLPNSTEYKTHLKIHVLDLGKTYLGPAGSAAVVPVISACKRLSHVNLNGVGLSYNVALALIERLAIHPSVREVNLSNNDLGTTVAEKLLHLVTGCGKNPNRRIYSLGGLENTLIIPALKKKIDAALAKNYYMRMEYSPDPLTLLAAEQLDELSQEAARRKGAATSDDIDEELRLAIEGAKHAEEERRLTAKRLKEQAQQQLPSWFPVAAAELCGVLNRQRDRMNEVLAVFSSAVAATKNATSSRMRASSSDGAGGSGTMTVLSLNQHTISQFDSEAAMAASSSSQQQQQQQHPSLLTETIAIHLDALCERVPLRSFQRAMKVFNVTALADSIDRCALFVEAFGALYVDMSLEEAIRVAQHKMAAESAAKAIAIAAMGAGAEENASPTTATTEDPTLDIIAATSNNQNGIVTAAVGTPEGDKAIAQLPLDEQIEAARMPVNQHYHHVPRPPSASAAVRPQSSKAGKYGPAVTTTATTIGSPSTPTASSSSGDAAAGQSSNVGSAAILSFTRYLAEDQKDLLLVNVPKIISALRVHAKYSSVRATPTAAYTSEVTVGSTIDVAATDAAEEDYETSEYYHTHANANTVNTNSSCGDAAEDAELQAYLAALVARRVKKYGGGSTTNSAPSINDASDAGGAEGTVVVDGSTANAEGPLSPLTRVTPAMVANAKLRLKAKRLQKWLFTMLSDKLFDARKEIYECATLLDHDNQGLIYFHELCSGVGSITMVHLFTHRREISRYIKMMRTIEAEDERERKREALLETMLTTAGATSTGSGKETLDWGGGGDNNVDTTTAVASVSSNTAAAGGGGGASPSYHHDTDHDLSYMGVFVERYLKHVLRQQAVAVAASSSYSAPSTSNVNSLALTCIDPITGAASPLDSDDAITAFALVPYRSLFGSVSTGDGGGSGTVCSAPVITVTEAAALSHRQHRCTPNFWAHATRRSLEVLMNPPALEM